jgi:hypothetical protein
MRSACSGTKSESIRVPVFSSSGYVSIIVVRDGSCGGVPLLGLRNDIVVGTVTSVVTVRMKKGKN